ncbi:MAG: hypothetical protein D6815_07060 [Candidatus Dadabacteria bacterium]|nr:MAG: hypothetical protein D6815_07060 [Candidatus Dadabacteria bacterium]
MSPGTEKRPGPHNAKAPAGKPGVAPGAPSHLKTTIGPKKGAQFWQFSGMLARQAPSGQHVPGSIFVEVF